MAIFDKKKKENQKTEIIQPDGRQEGERQPTNEEAMARRQTDIPSSVAEEATKIRLNQMNGQGMMPNGVQDGFRTLSNPIGKEAILEATRILQKYKEGKANLEQRIIDNEEWYKLRHWECMRRKNHEAQGNAVEPTSGWLFNCIANKHADAMDNFPSPNVLPREEGDKAEAQMLSSIIPVILDQNDFEKTYDEVWTYKLKTGTGVYGVFWDADKLNGLGDISIRKVDLINLFWEPGITDIQDSRNLFNVQLVDNEILEKQYPQLKGKLSTTTIDIAKYIYDDTVDTTEKSVVIDWYTKKTGPSGRKILHMTKYVNDVVLSSTENDPVMSERGLYDHGRYPFELDPLFRIEGTPAGFGYIDVGKSSQEYIDRGNQAIMQNMLSNARPRYFIRSDGSINEKEYADMTKDFIHSDSTLGQDSILPVEGKPLNDIYVTVLNNKIEELKETTGNRDVATGGTTGGVTAASGIAAMQESASRLSRQDNKASYRVFRQICLDVIELIRQFYDAPRCFRIMGEAGMQKFVQYSNANLQPQMQGNDFGIYMGVRIPLFDIEVTAQKASPYSKLSQNELALQFYQAGFFNPTMADQALACLEMMDFDRKDFIMQRIQQNGGMLQQMMLLAQIVDSMGGGGEVSAGIAQQFGVEMPQQNMEQSAKQAQKTEALGGDSKEEAQVTKKERQRVADSTSPT